MKKTISLYSLLAAGTLLAACNEDFNTDIATPQAWPEEAAAGAIQFTANPVAAIKLAEVADDSVTICSFTPPAVEGAVYTYEVALSKADGTKATLGMNAFGKVAKADLQQTLEDFYGKRPEERTLTAVVSVISKIDKQAMRSSAAGIEVKATPQAPLIDTAYYLIGNMNDWNTESLIKLKQSGKDVYEDPVFSIVIEVPANCYWKVIPQRNVDAGNVWDNNYVLGCSENGDLSLKGTLVSNPEEGPGAMQIEHAGWVKITLNMLEYSYTIEEMGEVSPYLYVPGDHQGWAPVTAPMLYSADFSRYRGFLSLNKEFKIATKNITEPWGGVAYGTDAQGNLNTDGGNITVPESGFYLLTVDMGNMSWQALPIKTFGLIGDATEGGWDASTPMEFDAATATYTVTTTLKGSGEFKFRANNGWDISLGGDPRALTLDNGANIPTPGEGIYKVVLDLSHAEAMMCTLTKQ